MAINYITRARTARTELAAAGGIPTLISMVKQTESTSQSKVAVLAILWNMVYQDSNKTIMMDNNVLEEVRTYFESSHRNSEGVKCCYFLASHLTYHFPIEVMDSGIVDVALDDLQHSETALSPALAHKAEGACRLIHTVATKQTCEALAKRHGAVSTLLHVLFNVFDQAPTNDIGREQSGSILGVQNSCTMEKEAHPQNAFKMRAASALNHMSALVMVEQKVSAYMDGLIEGRSVDDCAIVWLVVQPKLRELIQQRPKLIELLRAKFASNCTHDMLITMIALTPTWPELQKLLDSSASSSQTVGDFLLMMFDEMELGMSSRWAGLCQSLTVSGLADCVASSIIDSNHYIVHLVARLVKCRVAKSWRLSRTSLLQCS